MLDGLREYDGLGGLGIGVIRVLLDLCCWVIITSRIRLVFH